MAVLGNLVSSFAVDIDLNSNATDSDYGISGGLFRCILTDMTYDSSNVLNGDSCEFSSDGNAGETFDTSCKTGDLYAASNAEFKTADTEPTNLLFTLTDTTDFSGGELATAKGAGIAIGDVYLCSEDSDGDFTAVYKGSNVWEKNRVQEIGESGSSIDISKWGNYGTVSDFIVTLRNNDDLLSYLQLNNLELKGKTLREFFIISNISRQIYTGTIQDVSKTDTSIILKVTSNSLSKHTELPPRTVTQKEYTKLGVKNTTKSIPVTLGTVAHAKSVNISEVQEFEYLFRIDKFYTLFQIDLLQMLEGDEWIDTVGKAETVLLGNYINLVNDYNDSFQHPPDTEKIYKVESIDSVSGSVADGYIIKVTLERAFEEDIASELETKVCGTPDDLNSSWFVKIIDMENTRLTSNDEIAGYSRVSIA
jgi:hypothetical protein